MAEFTPEQEKEFEFRLRYEQEQAQKANQEQAPQPEALGPDSVQEATNKTIIPAVGAVAGAAASKLPEQFANMVKDPITGKWMALENYGRQMSGGKWYGGKHMGDVYQRIVAAGADPAVAAQYEAEALKNMGKGSQLGSKMLSKVPAKLQPLATSPMGVLGRGVVGFGAGMQGADALNRWNQGDTSGAVISGLGALGTAASMIPHPVARIGGTAIGLGAEGLNMFLDKLKNKRQMASGGLVDEEDGLSKAEKAALKILKRKKKVKHLADGGAVTGDSTFANTNLGAIDHPSIALPAMGVDENGVTTPAPIQVWNEATGKYQSSTDTTPGVMPGPIGGLGGLLAGENPAAPKAPVAGSTQPINSDAFALSGPLGGVNPQLAANSSSPFKTPIAQNDPTTGVYQQSNNTTSLADGLNHLFSPGGFGGGMTSGTQNLLNPQATAQMSPNSPVAAATPRVNFASAIRPGVAQNALNRFGTPLNQVRQAAVATPQTRRFNSPGFAMPALSRFRKR